MTKLSNKAYMTIDDILEEKKIITSEISDRFNDIKDKLSADSLDKFNELMSLFSKSTNSDTQIKNVIENEYHRKVPALYRKYPTSIA